MKSEDEALVEAVIWCLILVIFAIWLSLDVFAFPYSLNLSTGIITDLNSSDNSTNFTIYVIHIYPNTTINNSYFYNVTNIYQNITQNITYVNMTCLNCTNYYNQTINNSYFEYGYNKSDLNSNFVTLSDYNSWKSGLAYITQDTLTSQINSLNSTITKPAEVQTTWLWLSVLGLFLLIICLIGYIAWMSRGGE